MRITFLGSGGAFTDYRVNYNNNALIETEAGPVLLDCGTTAVQSMKELGVAPTDLQAVLITHLHADHASPEQLVWERYYGGEAGPQYLPTPLVAPADVLDPLVGSLEPFLGLYADPAGAIQDTGLDDLLVLTRTASLAIGGLRFSWFRVPHIQAGRHDKPAYGVCIDDGARKVLWSGDTTFAPAWIEAAAADPAVVRIFHECTFSAPVPGTVHTHFAQLATLPAAVQQRITLMHHTEVPPGTDLLSFQGAAARHQTFAL